jgi:4-diphosphocytidyl-2-C-methyl-D-erythritol kinase
MKVRAYAKINLGLHIIGKRADGYHSLETVFHQVNLFDEIEFKATESGVSFRSNESSLLDNDNNLCVNAARLLSDVTGHAPGVDITLTKKIPVGAGLGGGSSDAAAVLKGLRALWNLELTNDELRSLGAALGSDVPFFIDGGTAFATGRGEILEPMDIELPFWILVATPPLRISTRWAYEQVNIGGTTRSANLRDLFAGGPTSGESLRSALRNDFEDIVFEHYPELGALKQAFLRAGADVALLSGSGSSVFGLFRRRDDANRAAASIEGHHAISFTEPSFKPELLTPVG